jgi:hypothetical protein
LSLTNNTGSRVTANEEPLTGQSGPVNLASEMPPRKKTPEKERIKERRKDFKKNREIKDV